MEGEVKRFNGTISELLVFDKPLTKIDTLKFDYLAKKWEITSADDYDGDGILNQEERSIGSSPFDDKDKPIRIGAGSSGSGGGSWVCNIARFFRYNKRINRSGFKQCRE